MAATMATTIMRKENGVNNDQPIEAEFNYWASREIPSPEELMPIFYGLSPKLQKHTNKIEDIRSSSSRYTLDADAFQVLKHNSILLPPLRPETEPVDFQDQDFIKSTYWPEVTELVKSTFKARAAVVFNTTVREVSETNAISSKNPRANPKASYSPFFMVHGDYTASGARAHLRAMLSSFFEDTGSMHTTTDHERDTFMRLRHEVIQAEDQAIAAAGADSHHSWDGTNYAGPRWAILSVWRPLSVVKRDPLAILDPKSMKDADSGITSDSYVRFPRKYLARPGFIADYESENLMPLFPGKDGAQRWLWLSDQQPDEVFAIKLFDSDALKTESDLAPFAAHSAFTVPGTGHLEPRRSVELRVAMIW